MMVGGNDGLSGDGSEIGCLVRESRRQQQQLLLQQREQQDLDSRDIELNLYRSGSAPPTVDGSLSAVGGLLGSCAYADFLPDKIGNGVFSEEELRSDLGYLSYYYSNAKLNPRLPPPGMSKEDWRFTQRLKGASSLFGGIEDRREVNRVENGASRSFFSTPPGFALKKEEMEAVSEEVQGSPDWGMDGLIGLRDVELGSKQKSLTEIIQGDLSHSNPGSRHPSRPVSRNAFDENIDIMNSAQAELANLRLEAANIKSLSAAQHIGAPASYSYVAALGTSLSRSTVADPQQVARAPSPCPTPIGSERQTTPDIRSIIGQKSFHDVSSTTSDSAGLLTALSGLNLSSNGAIDEDNFPSHEVKDAVDHRGYLLDTQGNADQINQHLNIKSEPGQFARQSMPGSIRGIMGGRELRNNQVGVKSTGISGSSRSKVSSASALNTGGLSPHYAQLDGGNSSFGGYGLSGYSLNPALPSMIGSQIGNLNLPPLLENVASASAMGIHGMDFRGLGALPSATSLGAASDPHNLNRMADEIVGNSPQASFLDPMYLQYLRSTEYAAQIAALSDHSPDRNYMSNSYMDMVQKAYLGSLISSQKSPYGVLMGNNSDNSYYGNHAFGVGSGYPGTTMVNPVLLNSPIGHGSPMRHNEFNMRFPASMRNVGGVAVGSWNMDGTFGSSLLEEFKSNKAKSFELSDIAGHVVEFSADQYGSRFIQQKLETATTEENNMVFEEIIPQALSLMTDVFGNYVIQKFFEHGMPAQRRELAGKLDGNVLSLSLQMYGCRVIQKAIEVVDLDQKIKMVHELDGHIMRCVRDQNGNHVIQKCIECVPENAINFIVESFFDKIVDLSTHPYGCRVVQRVLEHCKDPKTQSKVMDEIMGSVSKLAQDQYGNYVIQHVLEHGKPHERSTIIKELAGKIVQMSQQKFASNVVEKCLTFGSPDEREFMVNEMLGTTDENEPLQAMMKDQFANYVVQKLLETCNDQQRELILTRIKVHLNALKKYTYGKHIVARVEKLVAAGERRIAGQSQHLG